MNLRPENRKKTLIVEKNGLALHCIDIDCVVATVFTLPTSKQISNTSTVHRLRIKRERKKNGYRRKWLNINLDK